MATSRLPLLPETAPFAAEQIQALNAVMATTSEAQRHWLSGFLAGYHAATGAAAPAAAQRPAAVPDAKQPLTILYATESGNAEELAAAAKKAAGQQGFAAKIVDMADIAPADLAGLRNLLVIASTWGEGDPPERAVPFYEALMADGAPQLDGVSFAVLALGDSSYVNFCATGRAIDERLAALGAKRVAARVDCDLDYDEPAAAWTKGALGELAKLNRTDDPAHGHVIQVNFAELPASTPAYDKNRPFPAEITDLVVLSGSRSSKETLHLELSLAGSGLIYEPGDSLGIVTENDPAMVDAILAATGLVGEAALAEELRRARDITVLSRPVIEAYAKLNPDPELAALSRRADLPDYLHGRQIIDLLETFPKALTPGQLTGMLRKLPTRLYSVASSQRANAEQADLLLGVVRYESHGRARGGVATTCVADRLKAGDRLPIYVKPNKHFRLPAEGDRPVIMIGPGTGVAPFRGFMQEREASGARGRNWLFFGDRTYLHDFLYQLEWQDWDAAGLLTRIDLAFSRDQPEKIYVQHRLWQRRAEVWAWLEEGAHLYVCGDEKAMAKDVEATLQRIVAEAGGRGEDQAKAYLAELKRSGRYQRDVY
jgi:sulfite reductase (NADPH) flavoprotein alpha-component